MQKTQNSSKAILIVEDDQSISDAYTYKLRTAGFEVTQAFDGVEALYIIKNTKIISLVILDLRMPKMSGEVVLDKMRKLEQHKSTPVIVLTNLSRSEAPKTIWHYGISDYFVKVNHTPSDLLQIINNVLSEV